jgi:TonB system transport protein ExbD (group 1)
MSGALPREGDEDDVAAEINVTPFIDVMLVLLIVFMVAAPLSTVDVSVNLPTSSAEPAERPADPVWLTVTAEGAWSIGEVVVARDGLAAALAAASDGDRGRAVLIQGDAALPYAQVMEVLDALRAAGWMKVALVGKEAAGR